MNSNKTVIKNVKEVILTSEDRVKAGTGAAIAINLRFVWHPNLHVKHTCTEI